MRLLDANESVSIAQGAAFLDVCLDPRAVLERLAAYHGARALEAVAGVYIGPAFDDLDEDDVRAHLADAGRVAVDCHIAETESRLAWRFALGVIRLDDAEKMATLLARIGVRIDAELAS